MIRLPLAFTQIPETMRRLAYFNDWPLEVLDRLSLGAKVVSVNKKGVLARKGERLNQLYIVVSGQVRLYIPLPNGLERVVALVHQGESFGEVCLVLNEVCPYVAIACKDTRLLVIDAMVYRQELADHALLARKTLDHVAKRLLETLRDAEICAQPSSLQRVACFLLRHQPDPATYMFKFQLPARKQDIAAKLGLTQETFSRVLNCLDKQGVIQMKGALISVEDGGKLAEMTAIQETKCAEVKL